MPTIDRWKLAQYKAARLDQARNDLSQMRKQKREEGYQDVQRQRQGVQWKQQDVLFGEQRADRILSLADQAMAREQRGEMNPLDVGARKAQIAREKRPDPPQLTTVLNEQGNYVPAAWNPRTGKLVQIATGLHMPPPRGASLTAKDYATYAAKAESAYTTKFANRVSGGLILDRPNHQDWTNWYFDRVVHGIDVPEPIPGQIAKKYQPYPQNWGVMRSGGLLGGKQQGSGAPVDTTRRKPERIPVIY